MGAAFMGTPFMGALFMGAAFMGAAFMGAAFMARGRGGVPLTTTHYHVFHEDAAFTASRSWRRNSFSSEWYCVAKSCHMRDLSRISEMRSVLDCASAFSAATSFSTAASCVTAS